MNTPKRSVVIGQPYTITFEDGRLQFTRTRGYIKINVSADSVKVLYPDPRASEQFSFDEMGRAEVTINLGLGCELTLLLQRGA